MNLNLQVFAGMWKQTVERRLPMRIAVVTDSGTGWTMEQARSAWSVLSSARVKCGDENSLDGAGPPVSGVCASQARRDLKQLLYTPVGKVEALFEELKQEQIDHVIAVPMTSGISSTAEMIGRRTAQKCSTLSIPYREHQGYLALLAAHHHCQRGVGQQIGRRLKACVEHSIPAVPDDLHRLKPRVGQLTPSPAACWATC